MKRHELWVHQHMTSRFSCPLFIDCYTDRKVNVFAREYSYPREHATIVVKWIRLGTSSGWHVDQFRTWTEVQIVRLEYNLNLNIHFRVQLEPGLKLKFSDRASPVRVTWNFYQTEPDSGLGLTRNWKFRFRSRSGSGFGLTEPDPFTLSRRFWTAVHLALYSYISTTFWEPQIPHNVDVIMTPKSEKVSRPPVVLVRR